MSFLCLLADAGHTRVKLARAVLEDGHQLPQVTDTLTTMNEEPIDWPRVAGWFAAATPASVVVTGTNLTRARELVADWPAELPAPTLLLDKSELPLMTDVDVPQQVGIDRLLNAVAANALRGRKQPVISVDTGTAITIDVLSAEGVFRGGAILPGILLGARSLHEQTTTLPLINVWQLLKTEPELIGKNTSAAIASGLYWGHLGAVKEMVLRLIEALYETDGQPLLLLTGGAAPILAPYLKQARHEPWLSLQGLAITARHLQTAGYRGMGLGGGV